MHPVFYYLLAANLAGFAAFGADKYRAIRKKWRIPERTLFLIALLGGSAGCLLGMLLFRHKIRKRAFVFGIPAILILELAAAALFFSGPLSMARQAKAAVRREFDQLRDLGADAVEDYISYEDIFPDSERKRDVVSREISEIFPLFFENFDYKIHGASVSGERASVQVTLTTLDAEQLAKDFEKMYMEKQISSKANPSSVSYSAEDSYLLLCSLLKANDYGTRQIEADVSLFLSDGKWQVERTDELDEQLTGYFTRAASSTELFSPSEVVEIHFDTLKSFDTEQLKRYFHLEDWLSMSEESYVSDMARALAEQIHTNFDYEITGAESISDMEATVSIDITSLDFNEILKKYAGETLAYTQTSQALQDGSQVRLQKANQILLNCIADNTASATVPVTVTLSNSGTGWKMTRYGDATQAILGNIDAASRQIQSTMRSAE